MNNTTIPAIERSRFRKSTRSGQDPQACVEVARERSWVVIRDSKQDWNSADDHRLVFTAQQFDAWLAAQGGAGTTEALCIDVVRHGDDINVFRSTVPQDHDNVLVFTDAEVEAFLAGVRGGEFAEARFARI